MTGKRMAALGLNGVLLLLCLYLIIRIITPPSPSPIVTPSRTPPVSENTSSSSPHTVGTPGAMADCLVTGSLPDSLCTPGATLPNATKEVICQPGYASSVRDVPQAEKDQAYAEYGITSHTPGHFEVDHLISLELGGSNALSNLWPEAASPVPGFHEKDQVENFLHAQVCSGAIPLATAQAEIARDWLLVYGQMQEGMGRG